MNQEMEPNIIKPEIVPAPHPFSKTAIASLIIGILSLPLIFLKIGLVAVVIGIIGIFKIRKYGLKGKGIAIAGIILGLISMLVSMIPLGTYFELLFNPNKLSGIKSESTLRALNTNVQLIEQYKNTNGKYPAKFYDVPNTLPSLYQIYYKVSDDGKSYILRSNGVDGICGNEDDILPTASTQPKIIDCVVDLGGGASANISSIKNGGEFNVLNTYQNKNYGFSVQYPSVWRVYENDLRAIEPVLEWGIRLSKINLQYADCTSCFGGAQLEVKTYNVETLKNKSKDSNPVDYIANASGWDAPTIIKIKFLGYDARSVEEIVERNDQYVGQKSKTKTIVFQKDNTIFAVSYKIDTTLPIEDSMNVLLNGFKFNK